MEGVMLCPRDAYRLRRAAAQIARIVREQPGVVAFPVLKTRDPIARQKNGAEIFSLATWRDYSPSLRDGSPEEAA